MIRAKLVWKEMKEFKEFLVKLIDEHFHIGLYTLQIHLFNYMMENIEDFGSLEMLNSSMFGQFNVLIERV